MKKLQIYISRTKPFINNYKFIKGFEEGSLEFKFY